MQSPGFSAIIRPRAVAMLAVSAAAAHGEIMPGVRLYQSADPWCAVELHATGFENPGLQGVSAECQDAAAERNADGHPVGILHRKFAIRLDKAVEPWAAGDPKAFRLVAEEPPGKVKQTTTVAWVELQGERRFVIQVDDGGKVSRTEWRKPAPDTDIVDHGPVVAGRHVPRERTVTRTSHGGSRQVQRVLKQVWNPADALWDTYSDIVTHKSRQRSWWRTTKMIHDPDGRAFTTEFEYHPEDMERAWIRQGSVAQMRVKSMRSSGGTGLACEFARSRDSVTVVQPVLGARRRDRLRSPSGGDTTIIESSDGTETARTEYVGGTQPKVTRHVTGPDGQTLAETMELIPAGQPFAGFPRFVTRPDGTIAIHRYETLPGGGQREILDHGKGDKSAVTAGTRTITETDRHGRLVNSRKEPIRQTDHVAPE